MVLTSSNSREFKKAMVYCDDTDLDKALREFASLLPNPTRPKDAMTMLRILKHVTPPQAATNPKRVFLAFLQAAGRDKEAIQDVVRAIRQFPVDRLIVILQAIEREAGQEPQQYEWDDEVAGPTILHGNDTPASAL
jgi:hypothetical protein